jgi:hypothetical protein
MVLTKAELLTAVQNEIRLLLHLVSKVDAAQLDYRPTAKQRSTLELLQYLTIFGPIHGRAVKAGVWDKEAWSEIWRTEEAAAKERNLEQIQEAIARQQGLMERLVGSCTDAELRAQIELFGAKASRGSWFVSLVLCHYSAYRMQLFLYLKSSGREELNTMNLWAGRDAASAAPAG